MFFHSLSVGILIAYPKIPTPKFLHTSLSENRLKGQDWRAGFGILGCGVLSHVSLSERATHLCRLAKVWLT